MELADGVASQHRRVAWVKHGLIACIVLAVVALFADIAQYALLGDLAAGVDVDPSTIEANDSRQLLFAWLQNGAFIVTAVFWLVWFHRAYGNLKLLGRKHTKYGPGWAVGYWFVPVVNLVMPYLLTRETWLKSASGSPKPGVPRASRAPRLGAWWTFYLFNGASNRFAAFLVRAAETVDDWILLTQLATVGDVLIIVASVLAFTVVSSIDRAQVEAVRAAAAEPALVPSTV
ncbi:MAG: DUF4328 domain-containing protein [Planctomycetes bacterium]|nr:DUF4328 domain-containing protein [Planctomycetota bacterium]